MIESGISSKAQTTIPKAIRLALGLQHGDRLGYRIEEGEVRLTRVATSLDPFDTPFANFTEWADELDSAYDNL